MIITVSGYSDDIISIQGDFNYEFDRLEDSPAILQFSEGTKLEVYYDGLLGLWKINQLVKGSLEYSKTCESLEDLGGNYTDVAELTGDFWWIKLDTQVALIQTNIPKEYKETFNKIDSLLAQKLIYDIDQLVLKAL